MRELKRHKYGDGQPQPQCIPCSALGDLATSGASSATSLPVGLGHAPSPVKRATSSVASTSGASEFSNAAAEVGPAYIGGSHCPLDGWFQACR